MSEQGNYERANTTPYRIVPNQLSNEALLEADRGKRDSERLFPTEVQLDRLGRLIDPRQFIIAGTGRAIDAFLVGKKFWLEPAEPIPGIPAGRFLVDVIKSRKPSPQGKRYVLVQTMDGSAIANFDGHVVNVFKGEVSAQVVGVIHPGESNQGGGREHSGQASCFGISLLVERTVHFAQNHSPEIGRLNQVATYEHDAALGTATVAVLDSGILFMHPRVGTNTTCSDIGWDFVTDSSPEGDPFPEDDHPGLHGSKICTIIKHMAPGAGILPVKVAKSNGTLTLYDALCGLEFARTHGACVVNASWSFMATGGTGNEEADYPMMLQAIRDLEDSGILVVAAAGNRSQYTPAADGHIGGNGAPNIYPACYSDLQDNVITVTTVATSADGHNFSTFENYSDEFVDTGVVANAIAPEPAGQFKIPGFKHSYQGSSFATPYVAAKIAQMSRLTSGYISKRAVLHHLKGFHKETQLTNEIRDGGSYVTV